MLRCIAKNYIFKTEEANPGTNTFFVADSPHSGRIYPKDFNYSCSITDLREAEDFYVDRLFDFFPSIGTPFLRALFPRSYIDLNRNISQRNTERHNANSLFRSICTRRNQIPIYSNAISRQTTLHRIFNYYAPYDLQLGKLLDQTFREKMPLYILAAIQCSQQ